MKLAALIFVCVFLAPSADTVAYNRTDVSVTLRLPGGGNSSSPGPADVQGAPQTSGRDGISCLANSQRFLPNSFSRVFLLMLFINNQVAICSCLVSLTVLTNGVFGYAGQLTFMAYVYNCIIAIHLNTILLRTLQTSSDWIPPLKSIFTVFDNVAVAGRFGGVWFACFMMLELCYLAKAPARNRDYKTSCFGCCVAFVVSLYAMGVMVAHIFLSPEAFLALLDVFTPVVILLPLMVALGIGLYALDMLRQSLASGSGMSFESRLVKLVVVIHLPELVSCILAVMQMLFLTEPHLTCFWQSNLTVAFQTLKLIFCVYALREFRAALLRDLGICCRCDVEEEKKEKGEKKEEEGACKKELVDHALTMASDN